MGCFLPVRSIGKADRIGKSNRVDIVLRSAPGTNRVFVLKKGNYTWLEGAVEGIDLGLLPRICAQTVK